MSLKQRNQNLSMTWLSLKQTNVKQENRNYSCCCLLVFHSCAAREAVIKSFNKEREGVRDLKKLMLLCCKICCQLLGQPIWTTLTIILPFTPLIFDKIFCWHTFHCMKLYRNILYLSETRQLQYWRQSYVNVKLFVEI